MALGEARSLASHQAFIAHRPPPPPNNYDQQAQLPTPPGLDTNDGLGKRSTCSIKKRHLRPHVSHPAIIAIVSKTRN